MKLQDKIALIPGGTKGTGLEIAKAYAGEGAIVIVSSRKQENVDSAVKEIAEIGKAFGYACDISDPAQVKNLVDMIEEKHGPIDIMLNSAGIYPNTPFGQISPEEAQAVINTVVPQFRS